MIFDDESDMPISFNPNSGGDSKIMSLAAYDVVNGRVVVNPTFEIAKLTAAKFNQFKSYIQSGECTMNELHEMVMRRCGPTPKAKMLDAEKDTLEVWNEIQTEGELKEQAKSQFSGGNLLQSILRDFAKGGKISETMDLGDGRTLRFAKINLDPASQNPFPASQNPFAGALPIEQSGLTPSNREESSKPLYNANDEKWKSKAEKYNKKIDKKVNSKSKGKKDIVRKPNTAKGKKDID